MDTARPAAADHSAVRTISTPYTASGSAAHVPEDAPRSGHQGVEELSTGDSWRLIESHRLGRLAIGGADGAPDVFPLNYLVHNGCIFVRSAPGSKLRAMSERPSVAFEIDGQEHGHHWSVVIRGTADRLDADDEIEASGVLDLVTWTPTEKHNFVRITPASVSGRRFRSPEGMRPRMGGDAPVRTATVEPPRPGSHEAPPRSKAQKPQPIPHFAPPAHDAP
jgi:nitroimidazol reductase NimA-like FMN-containing flavoprotein (pyridoxamine 5'-phosphate oxidase superfamily)